MFLTEVLKLMELGVYMPTRELVRDSVVLYHGWNQNVGNNLATGALLAFKFQLFLISLEWWL